MQLHFTRLFVICALNSGSFLIGCSRVEFHQKPTHVVSQAATAHVNNAGDVGVLNHVSMADATLSARAFAAQLSLIPFDTEGIATLDEDGDWVVTFREVPFSDAQGNLIESAWLLQRDWLIIVGDDGRCAGVNSSCRSQEVPAYALPDDVWIDTEYGAAARAKHCAIELGYLPPPLTETAELQDDGSWHVSFESEDHALSERGSSRSLGENQPVEVLVDATGECSLAHIQ